MKRLTGLAFGAVLFWGLVASAQPPGPPTFDSLDTDENGALSRDEVAALLARFGGGRGGPPPGGGQGGGRGGPPGGFNPDMIFDNWDADDDGAVTREEFDARPRFGGRGGPGGRGGRGGPGGGGPGGNDVPPVE